MMAVSRLRFECDISPCADGGGRCLLEIGKRRIILLRGMAIADEIGIQNARLV